MLRCTPSYDALDNGSGERMDANELGHKYLVLILIWILILL